jgi:hypothetical protein
LKDCVYHSKSAFDESYELLQMDLLNTVRIIEYMDMLTTYIIGDQWA